MDRRTIRLASFLPLVLSLFLSAVPVRAAEPDTTLRIIVMDPLALPLSCSCVKGHGQRRYTLLEKHLAAQLKRPVKCIYDEGLLLALSRTDDRFDAIVGKRSVVDYDLKMEKIKATPVMALTDKEGRTDVRGVFLVRTGDRIKNIKDLKRRHIALGPREDLDAHDMAVKALADAGIIKKVKTTRATSMDGGAVMVAENEADAAVVSEYLPVLYEGCGKVDPGSLRIVGQTDPAPFITVYINDALPRALNRRLQNALLSMADDKNLLTHMESKSGFVRLPERPADTWSDWRGPDRKGLSPFVPSKLPDVLKIIWSVGLTGPPVAGPAVTETYTVIPDKSKDQKTDIFRCVKTSDGSPLWTIESPAPHEMDYTNAPRTTPVIHGDVVYLLGALGDLRAVELKTGKTLWEKNLFLEFKAELLTWGATCAPLVVDDLLIVNPGAPKASVVALDRKTGKVEWKTKGPPAAYGAFVVGTFAGKRQIIGYDSVGLGGWDPKSGKRLWTLIPTEGSDFNVTTPLIINDRILLATENNGTRLYGFDDKGRIIHKPVLENLDVAPDTCTPILLNGRLFMAAYGSLFALDFKHGLKTLYEINEDMYYDHVNVIGGNNRVLIWTIRGDLLLIRADVDAYKVLSHLRPFGEDEADSMAHPALLPGRLFLRSKTELVCFELPEE